jgi:hypothetical protein
MIEGLPPGGPRARALVGHHWGDQEQLLAIIGDRIAEVGVALVKTMGGKARAPKPLPRPGQKPTGHIGDRAGRSVSDVIAYLDSLVEAPAAAPGPAADEPAPTTPVFVEPVAADAQPQIQQLRDQHGQLVEQNTAVLRAISDEL